MTGLPLTRTEYWSLSIPGSVRTGATGHGESLTDMENFLLPLSQSALSALHTPGVADGLTVTVTTPPQGLTVSPGVALDDNGHLIVLAAGGVAIVDPGANPSQLVNVPTVQVSAAGAMVVSAGSPVTGAVLLTVTYAEVVEGQLSGTPVLVHAPWLRLLAAANVTADQVVLAGVTLDSAGNVTALSPASRPLSGLPVAAVQIRRPRATAGPPLSVDQSVVAQLAPGGNGGVTLDLTPAGGPLHVLAVDDAAGTLSLLPAGGTVGVGSAASLRSAAGGGLEVGVTAAGSPVTVLGVDSAAGTLSLLPAGGTVGVGSAASLRSAAGGGLEVGVTAAGSPVTVLGVNSAGSVVSLLSAGGMVGIGLGTGAPQRILHAEGPEVHSGGSAGGFSFANRDTGQFVESPTAGERWVWYASGGRARLWSGGDRLSIDLTTDGGALDVSRRMRVRQGTDASAGIWLYQTQPQADRAFVGMSNDSSVGFWGNTGVGWGLLMDTSSGNVGIGTTPSPPGVKLDVQVPNGFAIRGTGGPGFLGIGGGIWATGPTGVLAQGTTRGILAGASSGPAGQFDGDVTISGKLSKGGGGFTIDDPTDPENRYLSHSFVESPEMLNVYRGTVTTDQEGAATVELPGYVTALNREFSYHLTVVGDFARAVVSAPLHDGRLSLRTDQPGVTVCWLVLGVRADPWAEANRIEVERDKPDSERNLFLHPELYNQPPTRSLLHSQYPALGERVGPPA
jgi:hypothetical protein